MDIILISLIPFAFIPLFQIPTPQLAQSYYSLHLHARISLFKHIFDFVRTFV